MCIYAYIFKVVSKNFSDFLFITLKKKKKNRVRNIGKEKERDREGG